MIMQQHDNIEEYIEYLEEQIYQLKTILNHVPGNLYLVDPEGRYIACNKQVADLFHLDHPDDIKGKTLYDLYNIKANDLDQQLWPVNIEETQALNIDLIKKEQEYAGEEIANILPNEPHTFLSKKVMVRDRKNKIVGLLGISFDITDRKNMEKALHEAKEKAEIANQAKTDFIRNMEHDLRTPLCGVLEVSNYLLSTEKEIDRKDLLIDVEKSVKEVLNYFDHIVEFSRLNQHGVPKLIQQINLKKMIEGVVTIESAALRNKNIHLMIDYPDNIPTMIQVDRFRIQRILLNLVNNAIKFTKEGCIKIKVEMIEKSEKKLIQIMVEDTGIGIAKKNQEMIFDKFTRCELTNKNIYKGTGLGLWIVKEFIQEMGGKIELKSELNQGACFALSIPFI